MNVITHQQRDEFYQGFVTAMLWSTGGEADYGELPSGYSIETISGVINQVTKEEAVTGWQVFADDYYVFTKYSERAATMAAWEHSGLEPPTLESLDDFDLAPVTAANLRAHCDAWVTANAALLIAYSGERHYDSSQGTVWEYAGHDFWMTSAGHGVGFWDRGLGELGDALTAACEQFQHKHDAYIGDDGLVYVSGLETPSKPAASKLSFSLTEAQLSDLCELVRIGAQDARHSSTLADYTDEESGSLERLADKAAPELLSILMGAC